MADFHQDSIFWVEVDKVRPNPYQPRRDFDEIKLNDLAESIRQYGVLQPIVVTRHETQNDDGNIYVDYELIAGERRVRASKLAGLLQIPALIRESEGTDRMKLELAIIENLQREDLNPIDRARAFDRLVKEFNFKHTQIAQKIGKSREFVTNSIRLLLLPEEMQDAVYEERITEGHTRPLLMLSERKDEQTVLFKEIMEKKLSVRESESIARRIAVDKVRKKSLLDPEIMDLERAFTESLGTRVQIEPREFGGKIVVDYFSKEDLQNLLSTIKGFQLKKAADGNEVQFSEEEGGTTPDDSAEEDLYSIKNFTI